MRVVCLILFVLACGCDFRSSGPGPNQTIRNGKDRLTLRFAPRGVPVPGGIGYDFHSLVWEREEGDFWRERTVISQEQFQAGTDRHRSVHELHSFDPTTGNAIIQIAEGNAPTNAGTVTMIYSWREWNLRTNGEIRFIRVCKEPFKKF
jgi:hypothetical protein